MRTERAYLQALTEQSGNKLLPALIELLSLNVRASALTLCIAASPMKRVQVYVLL